MPRLTLLIVAWLALTAGSGLASDLPAQTPSNDAAPLAPMPSLHNDSPAAASNYALDPAEGATSNLGRDILQATGGQPSAPQNQLSQPPEMAPAVMPPSNVVQASATEPIVTESHSDRTNHVAKNQADEHRSAAGWPDAGLNPLNVPLAGGHASSADRTTPTSVLITVGSSMAIVLGLFFFVAWAMRKAAPRGSIILPNEVFEILGRASLGGRQQVQLIRCGNKLVLLSITPAGTEPLTEVTDPLEVDRLAGICLQGHPRSSTKAFQQVFQQMAPRSGSPSPLDELENLKGRRSKPYRWESERV